MKVQEFHKRFQTQFTRSQHNVLCSLAQQEILDLWMGKGLDLMVRVDAETVFVRKGSWRSDTASWKVKKVNEINDVLEGWHWVLPDTCAVCKREFYLRLDGDLDAYGASVCSQCQ